MTKVSTPDDAGELIGNLAGSIAVYREFRADRTVPVRPAEE
jgi:hypothetical protein